MIKTNDIKLIAFDADDTLWDCQSHFEQVQRSYEHILSPYATAEEVDKALFETETANMPLLGYGCKAFTLSLVENAVRVSKEQIAASDLLRITQLGKLLLQIPATPLPGVDACLRTIRQADRYSMVVFTKGELLDQEHKLMRSGLRNRFDDVVIVSDKSPEAYQQLCRRFGVGMDQLLMVGNSFKSDIKPVLLLGGYAVHIPFHVQWQHEVTAEYAHPHLARIQHFGELAEVLGI